MDVSAENHQVRIVGQVPTEAHRRPAVEIATHEAGDQAQVIEGTFGVLLECPERRDRKH